MKYVGILLMSGALIAGGFLAAERLRERLRILQQFRQIALCLKGQILYSNATLPEALGEAGARFSEGRSGTAREPGELLLRVRDRLKQESGRPFSEVWEEELARLPEDLPLEKQDRQALSALGSQLGYADRAMQERTILLYLEQTEDSIRDLKGELDGRTKLCRCMGMAAGLFLMVVMA